MKEMYSELKTPAYVFEIENLNKHMLKITDILDSKIGLCFAMKANPFLIDTMSQSVQYIEVCSFGEFKIIERSNVPIERVILSGVYKNMEETRYIVQTYGNRIIYTIESKEQFRILKELAEASEVTINVLLRLSSGNQFGMSKEDVYDVSDEIHTLTHLQLYGIHFFSGTQKDSPTKYTRELSKLKELVEDIEHKYRLNDLRIEYGPGFSVEYFNEVNDADIYSQVLLINKVIEDLGISDRVTLEAGRFFTAFCGKYITEVVDVKKISESNICIVDGGIHHMSYYGHNMALKQPPLSQTIDVDSDDVEPWTVFGSLCTTSDVLARNVPLHRLKIGSRLIFNKVGSYSVTEGISLFLSHSLPSVYLYEQNAFKCVRDEIETHEFNYIKEIV